MGFAAAFMIGFLGSFHCVGMCGPIALALPFRTTSKNQRLFGILFYNLGRVVTYGLMGMLFGSLGWGLELAGFQQWISLSVGIVMLLLVLLPYSGIIKSGSFFSDTLFPTWMRRLLGKLMKSNRFELLGIVGMLNGLLPCGLVYMAVGLAIASGNWNDGALLMISFGLGTIPAMFSLPFIGQFAGSSARNTIRKAMPIVVVLMGTLFVLRGLNLGIPYISPKISYEVNGGVDCH
jgi:sulfite exporter TauE/SafE